MRAGKHGRDEKLARAAARWRSAGGEAASCLMALEPRVMYDAAGVVSLVDGVVDTDPQDIGSGGQEAAAESTVDSAEVADLFSGYVAPPAAQPKELVFVDAAVADYQQFLEGGGDDRLVVLLQPGEDGVARIGAELAQYTNLDAVHIVSHGDAGSLQLGSGTLSLASLSQNPAQIAGWGNALSSNGDILLYGCDVAAGAEGRSFVDQLAALTGADVAASTDTTGHADLGGDWDLEYADGVIDSAVPLAWHSYTYTLGQIEFVDSGQNINIGQTEGGALGDFDGDGDLDVFLVNTQSVDKVFLNDGSGNFTDSGQSLGNATDFGQEVAVGDLDRDGDLDAYVVIAGAPDKVYWNDGAGNFSDSGQALSASSGRAITLGDLDGDGDLDAMIANYGGNEVYLNDGAGLFSNSGQSLLVGLGSSQDVDLADLDGDGDLDAFVANWGSQANDVWLNNGAGSFTFLQSLGGSVSMGVSLGDVDKDGDIDAFVANLDGQPDKVWLNDGSANFSDSGQALGSSASYGVKLADIDRDGDLDAFVIGGNVWQNDGFGNYSDTGILAGGREVLLGDLDQDGDQDAFLVAGSANRVWYNQALAWDTDLVWPTTYGADLGEGVALGDLDGDGDLDAYVANDGPDRVWLNNGLGGLSDSGQSLGSSVSYAVKLGDLDGDGDLDAFVAGAGSNVWLNDGNGIFTDSGLSYGTANRGTALADVDGDGDLDAFLADDFASGLWLNNGSGVFSDSGQSFGISSDVALGDLDRDGALDVVFATNTGVNNVFFNDGLGVFASGQNIGNGHSVALGDVDGDGDLDIYYGVEFAADRIWLNDGFGTFVDSGQSLGSGESRAVRLGDFDGDGDLDAFVVNGGGLSAVWLNDSFGNFMDSGWSGWQAYGTAVGDLDRDGDLDVIEAGSLSVTTWFTNRVPFVSAGSSLAYFENDPATVIDPAIELVDLDSTTYDVSGATITISDNYVQGEDVLGFTDFGAISGNWDPDTATLTLSGWDTPANYQLALRSVTYKNWCDNPSGADRTISFSVEEGGFYPSAVATSTVTVTAVNDAPFLDNSGTPTLPAINEDDAASPAYSIYDLRAMFGDLVNDPDFNDPIGVAIVGADNSNGNWQYSTDGGATWNDVGIVSDSSALLLQGFPELMGKVQNTADLAANDLLINGVDVGAVSLSAILNNGVNMVGAFNLANAINAISGGTGVIAELETLYSGGMAADLTGNPSIETIDFDLNGIPISVSVSSYATSFQVAQSVADAIASAAFPLDIHAWVGNGSNGGGPDSVVIESDGAITLANLSETIAGMSGLVEGTYIADASHNRGDLSLIPTGGGYVITTSSSTDDSILALIGLDGGQTQTRIDGDAPGDGAINVSFPLNKIRYVPNADASGTASLSFRAWDQSDALANASTGVDVSVNGGTTPYSLDAESLDITVNPVDDAPEVVAGGVLDYTENDPAMVIDPAIVVGDIDSPDLVSAQVNISGNYVDGEDVLGFTPVGAISGSWDAATGILTLSGTDTVANYQAALASVTYQNLSDAPSELSRTVAFTVNDGALDSAVATATVNVSAVNDPPLVIASGVLNYTENDPASVIDGSIVVTDVDNASLTGAYVIISPGYVAGEDLVEFVDTGTISGSWDAGTGILTLSGTDTVANYQAALRSVTYRNLSDNPSVTPRTISFQVNDGAASGSSSATVNVAAVNDAPVVAGGGVLSYTESDPASVVDPGVVVSDLDSATLTGGTVAISGNYVAGEDVLGFTPVGAISGSWDAGTGILTLSGTDTVANYQAALASVTYQNLSDAPSELSRTVAFTVNDGALDSAVATATVNVVGVDIPPVISAGGVLTYTENDVAAIVDPTVMVSDADNADLVSAKIQIAANYVADEDLLTFVDTGTITGAWDASTGTLTLSGTDTVANYQSALRNVRYLNLSDNPSVATRSVGFTVHDGSIESAAAVSSINVLAVNDAPVAGGTAAMASIYLTDAGNDGDLVGSLVSGVVSDAETSANGIAVTGVDTALGAWQYSLDGGASWLDFGTLSDTSATLLADSARVRLVPNGSSVGTAGIIFRGWDQTSGANGQTGVNVGVNGGATAFSSGVAGAAIAVQDILPPPTTTTVTESTALVTTTTFFDAEASLDSTTLTTTTDSLLSTTDDLAVDAIDTDFLVADSTETAADADADADAEAETTDEVVEEEVEGEEDDQGEAEGEEEPAPEEQAPEVVVVDEGALAKEGQPNAGKELAGKGGLSQQLAREKGVSEAEQAEIVKIFNEVFDLLQCN